MIYKWSDIQNIEIWFKTRVKDKSMAKRHLSPNEGERGLGSSMVQVLASSSTDQVAG